MQILNEEIFIKKVEALIDPVEVHNLYFFQKFKRMLPGVLFRKLLKKTSAKAPFMGFVIEPYSLFLFFKLKDIEKAKSMLPERYELKKTRIFADDEPDYYLGMGNLYTRASTFWGIRLECYLVAEDRKTGLLSWIFIDILSNTIIARPSMGIADPNSRNAIFTTSSKGDIYLDVQEDKTGRKIKLKGNIKRGVIRKLDQQIWVMGNTSIAHSKELSDNEDNPFTVIFDPAEVSEALDVPVEDIHIEANTLFPDLAEPNLVKAACFPFAQHYVADSPGRSTYIKDPEDLIRYYNRITDLGEMKTFSSKNIRRMFFIVMPIANLALIVFLILKAAVF